jgi:hypothetical protein
MLDVTVLALAGDARWVEQLWSGLSEFAGCRLIVAETSDEAREILECVNPRLVVVNGDPNLVPDERIDEVLWSNSTLAHPATVVVAANSYDSDRAVALFQMGVDDYLGGSEHWSRLPAILGQLLSLTPKPRSTPQVLPVSEAIRPVRQVSAAPLRWVSAEPA